MKGQTHRTYTSLIITLIIFATGLGMIGCKKKTAPPPPQPTVSAAGTSSAQPAAAPANPTEAANTAMPLPRSPKIKLTDVIAAAQSWTAKPMAAAANDFTLTDLKGTPHKLSDYRGKNVILNFWATWSPHCRVDMPQLTKLRNEVSEEDLAILAITVISPRNPEVKIRQMVQETNTSVPVIATPVDALPAPFNQVEFLPSSFFIDTEGRIKLKTEGMVPAADMKSILLAQ